MKNNLSYYLSTILNEFSNFILTINGQGKKYKQLN